MAKRSAVPKSSGETVVCPHCGSVNDVDSCPTFNGQNQNGLFCSSCRGPLSAETVDNADMGHVPRHMREAAREGLREKVAATGL